MEYLWVIALLVILRFQDILSLDTRRTFFYYSHSLTLEMLFVREQDKKSVFGFSCYTTDQI